jgi:hypothetical protein
MNQIEIRNQIVNGLIKELAGPIDSGNEDNVIFENPINKYIAGTLYPQKDLIADQENDTFDNSGDDGSEEIKSEAVEKVNLGRYFNPSSMGMTFVTDVNHLENIDMDFEFTLYRLNDIDEGFKERWEDQKKITLSIDKVYIPINITCKFTLSDIRSRIKEKEKDKIEDDNGINFTINFKENDDYFHKYNLSKTDLEDEIRIKFTYLARIGDKNKVIISLSVVNEHTTTRSDGIKYLNKLLFHTKLIASSKSIKNCFYDRRIWQQKEITNLEDKVLAFLNRKNLDIATGLNCAVDWIESPEGCNMILTESIPKQEVPKSQPRQISQEEMRETGFFSILMEDLTTSKGISNLKNLLEAYKAWSYKLEDLKNKLKDVEDNTAMQEIIAQIKTAIERIDKGIKLISESNIESQSFIIMNQAMANLRKKIDPDTKPSWYPFQIGFILYCLESLSNKESDDRKIVDLLWFPTGGGKTEAYLGLMAYIIILRRLRSKNNYLSTAGTGVISRYTLRLLTLQQFRRTTSLICSLELLRSEFDILGDVEFSVGLWVGNQTTPEKISQASKSLNDDGEKQSVKQFGRCPWCNTNFIGHENYVYIQFISNHTNPKLICINENCEFSEHGVVGSIPAYMIDEQIYGNKPSIILGTVDKFARIPKLGRVGTIFGIEKNTNKNNLNILTQAPDLIIQDELHLIEGPLGSMYGLYELMIQGIIARSDPNNLPKVIASTATAKKANDLIKTLYGREGRIFPPQGFEIGDTFWSEIVRDEPGRFYLGVFGQGKSPKTIFIRIQAYLLEKVQQLKQELERSFSDEEVKQLLDPYWTIIGYFNSLRELGSAKMLARDDIPDQLTFLSETYFNGIRRDLKAVEELTSRLKSEDVSNMLEQITYQMNNSDVLDSIYATNMISVGVDIDRLGIMHVVGQPKSTAEYIQATARVGRKYPGIVITQYAWSKPRDQSHYQKFKYYHKTLDIFVDSLSATPFSLPARERALHAILFGLFRFSDINRTADSAAGKFKNENKSDFLRLIEEWIRVAEFSSNNRLIDEIKDNINKIYNDWLWLNSNSNGKVDYYYGSNTNKLMTSMNSQVGDNKFPKKTPDSLRSVEDSARYRISSVKDE